MTRGCSEPSIRGARSRGARGATVFAAKKTLAHPECQVCEYQSVCHGGCPKFRHGPNGRFDDLDYFCAAYKMIFGRAVEPLRAEVKRLLGRDVPELGRQAISPY